ncbi:MAG: hypothetical protein KAH32_01100 [Chlamydiia bacterium]|nr:hypothetical protein [Chlamydiia bacterium]
MITDIYWLELQALYVESTKVMRVFEKQALYDKMHDKFDVEITSLISN